MSGQSLGEEWHLLTISLFEREGAAMVIEWLVLWGVAEATKRHRLAQAIEESRAIADLAGNPLLLTMGLSVLFSTKKEPTLRLESSGEVREAAVEELARGWRTDPETLAFLEVKE
jgi:hypothetical protein